MVRLEFNGRPFNPRNFEETFLKAAMEAVATEVRERIGAVRHPETGEFPTIVVMATSLRDIQFRVEGSPELLAIVRERLGQTEEGDLQMVEAETETKATPHAFLSYASEDRELASKIAHALQANGIETWWSEWCVGPGDSLRQKIDEGLADCTHFIVLLTPASIKKPWVNQEMDAGLVRKIQARSKFIALRHGLPAEALPPLLSGMLSPEVTDPEADLRHLVNDIHGVSRKPAVGTPPAAGGQQTGYSAAASAVAKVFVDESTSALFGEPQLTVGELADKAGLSEDDVTDALHELRGMVQIHRDSAWPKDEIFATFDKFWRDWDPAADALCLAADLVNDESFPGSTPQIAQRYGWPPRRINPAIAYLINRDAIMDSKTAGTHPWITAWVKKTDATRRFVRSRS